MPPTSIPICSGDEPTQLAGIVEPVVLGRSPLRLSADTLPPVVYVPCAPMTPCDEQFHPDLRRDFAYRLTLPVYSALDRLMDCCGTHQPWVAVPAMRLEDIRMTTGFEVILLDVWVPKQFRREIPGGEK